MEWPSATPGWGLKRWVRCEHQSRPRLHLTRYRHFGSARDVLLPRCTHDGELDSISCGKTWGKDKREKKVLRKNETHLSREKVPQCTQLPSNLRTVGLVMGCRLRFNFFSCDFFSSTPWLSRAGIGRCFVWFDFFSSQGACDDLSRVPKKGLD